MKGGGVQSSYSLPAKRRWKASVIAVLGLVILSMVVPLVFLLGLHNGFHSTTGYGTEQRSSASNHPKVYEQNAVDARNQSKVHQSAHVDNIIKRLDPSLPKGMGYNTITKTGNDTSGLSLPAYLPKQVQESTGHSDRDKSAGKTAVGDESEVVCEVKFGGYCLWRQEHREKMRDSVVKRMKDLLFVARAYYPSIAKLPKLDELSHDMKQTIQDFERVLSEPTTGTIRG